MTDSAALYIHIPFCKSKCDYCDFFSVTQIPPWEDFTRSLLQEATQRKAEFGITGLSSVYIGGGTPSLMPNFFLHQLLAGILNEFSANIPEEITIEVNPHDCTEGFARFLATSPVTRISLGLQSMNDDVLARVGRRSSAKKNLVALENLSRFCSHKNISADFIAGLPGESEESLREGLFTLLKFPVEHISLYSLMVSPSTPLYDKIRKKKIAFDEDFSDKLWIQGRDFLVEMGFEQYEISNFCKNGKVSMHNMTYWKGDNYLGIGPGAVGTVDKLRYENSHRVEDWLESPGLCTTEVLSTENKILEFLMLAFRTNGGMSPKIYEQRFGRKMSPGQLNVTEKWLQKGLLTKTHPDENLALTSEGMLFLNKFLEELLSAE